MLRKKLSNDAYMRVVKPRLALKAFEALGLSVDSLEQYMTGQVMLILSSSKNSFELANVIENFVTQDYFSPGEVVDKEVVIPEGNTGIPAGPVLSVFGRLKVQTKVQGNVIHVAKDTTVAKPGDVVSQDLASILQKLGLALKETRIKVKCAYEEGLIVPGEKLKLNVLEYQDLIKFAAVDAFKLSVELVIPEPPVLQYVLVRAERQAIVLAAEAGFITPETAKEVFQAAHSKAVLLALEISKHAPDLNLGVSTAVLPQQQREAEEKKGAEKKEEEEKKEESKELSEEALAEGFSSLFG
ncbi:MAG: 50S ribosomal protein L10, partial [Desulfurococcaceae archaeon]